MVYGDNTKLKAWINPCYGSRFALDYVFPLPVNRKYHYNMTDPVKNAGRNRSRTKRVK
jgi:hypothetical protein